MPDEINGSSTRGHDARELRGGEPRKYMTTWASPGGEIGRQIDYIAIIAKYRDGKKAHSNIYWNANMHQGQQRRVQTMHIYYNAAKEYRKPIPAETGRG